MPFSLAWNRIQQLARATQLRGPEAGFETEIDRALRKHHVRKGDRNQKGDGDQRVSVVDLAAPATDGVRATITCDTDAGDGFGSAFAICDGENSSGTSAWGRVYMRSSGISGFDGFSGHRALDPCCYGHIRDAEVVCIDGPMYNTGPESIASVTKQYLAYISERLQLQNRTQPSEYASADHQYTQKENGYSRSISTANSTLSPSTSLGSSSCLSLGLSLSNWRKTTNKELDNTSTPVQNISTIVPSRAPTSRRVISEPSTRRSEDEDKVGQGRYLSRGSLRGLRTKFCE